jgi:DNA-binding response OmpR family regulator
MQLGRVLLIDDEISLVQTLTRILRQADCEVTGATSGNEALRLLDGCSYDLIYLDIRLPDLDGLQLLQEIRRRDGKLPVILLTAHGSLQSALQALRLGATDYLLKPVDPEVLLARTRVVLKEQAIERRRRDIGEQIAVLQAELKALEAEHTPETPPLIPNTGDRFLKRGQLILDLHGRRATFGKAVLAIPPTSFDYLATLARHAPEVVDYQMLVTETQGYQVDRREARELAKWHIHVLRQSLEADPKRPTHILNVRSGGYRLLVD